MPFLTSRSMSGPLSWARAAVAHTRAARPANTLDLRLNMCGWMDAWMNNEARRVAGIAADNRGRMLRFRDARVTTRQIGPDSAHSGLFPAAGLAAREFTLANPKIDWPHATDAKGATASFANFASV